MGGDKDSSVNCRFRRLSRTDQCLQQAACCRHTEQTPTGSSTSSRPLTDINWTPDFFRAASATTVSHFFCGCNRNCGLLHRCTSYLKTTKVFLPSYRSAMSATKIALSNRASPSPQSDSSSPLWLLAAEELLEKMRCCTLRQQWSHQVQQLCGHRLRSRK